MTFGQDRDQLRRMYADAWRKFNDGGVLSPLEAQIAAVASEHPEYHRYLGEDGLHEDFTPERGETNPFLPSFSGTEAGTPVRSSDFRTPTA